MSGKKQRGVKLAPVAVGQKKKARQKRFSARFHNVQEKACLRLMDLLAQMFDQADDVLFEMADSAASNQDQNIYFDSMRELRIRRRGMEMEFSQLYNASFEQLDRHLLVDSEEVEASKLCLVNDNEIEEMLALEGMVARSMNDCAEELSLLSMRFDSLLTAIVINNDNNPIAPGPICTAFAKTCGSLDVDIRARLVVLKLFEKAVVKHLPKLYQTLNRDLAEEGVLANISLASQRQRGGAQNSAYAEGQEAADTPPGVMTGAASNDNVFSQLQNLLQQAGQLFSGPARHTPPAPGAQLATVKQPMVLDLLTSVQNHLNAVPAAQTGYMTELPEQRDISEMVMEILKRNEPDGHYRLREADEDAINIVSLLFQFVLEDDNLAVPLKSLISLLQVPMAKVALLDKSFFGKDSHPARKLLNMMAQAGIGWAPASNPERDFLYRKVKDAVETVLTSFDDDIGIFQSVLSDFVSFMENERRRATVVEQRTLEAEQGKTRSDLAHTAVHQSILECTSNKPLPGVVSELLEHAWSKVLFLVYVREGEDSGSWKSALRVMEELVWSVQPKATAKERLRLEKLQPGLFKSLRNGLNRVGFSHFAMNHLFEQLEASYAYLLNIEESKPGAKKQAVESKTTSEPAGCSPTLDEMLSRGKAHIESASVEAVGAMTEVSGPTEAANNEDLLEGVDEAMLSAVDNLTMGSWVQFNQDDDASYRCRLAAVMKPTGKYIFVNRAGKKVAEWSREQLASNVARDIVRLLDDRLLFDRALESVISQLNSSR